MNTPRKLPWDWFDGAVPANVELDETGYVETSFSFHLTRSRRDPAVRFGRGAACYLGTMFDLGADGRVELGDYAMVHGARIVCDTEVRIGAYTMISWHVAILDTYRLPADLAERRAAMQAIPAQPVRVAPSRAPARPVSIGANVWIGFGACILPGVQIGDGSVVGAKSVVYEDVPALTVVAGNPARVIRNL